MIVVKDIYSIQLLKFWPGIFILCLLQSIHLVVGMVWGLDQLPVLEMEELLKGQSEACSMSQ